MADNFLKCFFGGFLILFNAFCDLRGFYPLRGGTPELPHYGGHSGGIPQTADLSWLPLQRFLQRSVLVGEKYGFSKGFSGSFEKDFYRVFWCSLST